MVDSEELLGMSSFYEDRWGTTLPKEVRKNLSLESSEQGLIFIQEEDGNIVLSHTGRTIDGGTKIITAADFARSVYQFSLPKKIRDLLKIKKGGKIAYWLINNEKIILRNAKK